MREGYHRTATNNIIINNGLHPHVWYRNSGDIFRNNILFLPYQPAIMNATIADNGKWGQELDFNFYVSDKEFMTRFAMNGCDINSRNGNPNFIDPDNGDFQVSINSPALKIGFVNFPMNQFGVIKPSLKAISKSPEIPVIKINLANISSQKSTYKWIGIVLKEPTGDEMSAFGVGFDSGGVVLTKVPENSQAAKLGFRTGDLIQELNGIKIKNIQNIINYIQHKNNWPNKHTFVLIRNQTKTSLSINQDLEAVTQLP